MQKSNASSLWFHVQVHRCFGITCAGAWAARVWAVAGQLPSQTPHLPFSKNADLPELLVPQKLAKQAAQSFLESKLRAVFIRTCYCCAAVIQS